jgi:hypothetical protein
MARLRMCVGMSGTVLFRKTPASPKARAPHTKTKHSKRGMVLSGCMPVNLLVRYTSWLPFRVRL